MNKDSVKHTGKGTAHVVDAAGGELRGKKSRAGYRVIAAVVVVLALVWSGCVWWRRAHRPFKPLEISLWYWHTPYHIEAAEAAQLKAIGVKQLFVLAGTFHSQHGTIHLIMPQKWEIAPAALGVHLVFHFDATLIKEFEKLPIEMVASSVSSGIANVRVDAVHNGVRVIGVQCDFDCPTRLLGRYGELMRRIRPALTRGTALSATALPTWYTSKNVELLMKQTDFLAPQYYEPEIPRTLDSAATISRISLLEHGLRAAGSHDYPFYVGIPAYGHALLYNEKGALLGMYHDMGITDAIHQSALTVERAFGADRNAKPASVASYAGEDIYDFKAVRADAEGHGLGYHLVYDLPTAELLRSYLTVLAANHPRDCRGVILFRYPEAGEPSTLPFTTIAATLAGRMAAPKLKVTISATAAPWEVAESGRKVQRVPHDVTITVTNIGDAGTFIAKDAVTIRLQFDTVGFDTADPGAFDSVQTLFVGESGGGNGIKASEMRSNCIQCLKSYLAPGETAHIGPIETQAAHVRGSWTIVGAGKLATYHGDIAETEIGPPGEGGSR